MSLGNNPEIIKRRVPSDTESISVSNSSWMESSSIPLSASFPPTWIISVSHFSMFKSDNLDLMVLIVAPGNVLTAMFS